MNDSKSGLAPGTIVATYARVSTQRQEKEETIKSQLTKLEAYVVQNKLKLYKNYVDNGYSGEILQRPALDELRNDAKEKRFDFVILTEADRLARKFIYQGYLEDELKKLGIQVLYLSRPQIASTPHDIAFNQIQGVFAELDKAIRIDRTRRGKLQKVLDGILITSIPPYGYKYIKKSDGGPKYVVDKREAVIVQLIYKLFIDNKMSLRGVTRELYRLGLSARNKRTFGRTTIKRILSNDIYIGNVYYNKNERVQPLKHKSNRYLRVLKSSLRRRPQNEWIKINTVVPKIISKEMFDETQRQLKQRRMLFRRPPIHQYLLTGLLFCGKCNNRLLSNPCHGIPYYRCSGKIRSIGSKSKCITPIIKARVLDEIVSNTLLKLLSDPEWIISYLKKATEEGDYEVKKIQVTIANKKKIIQEQDAKLNKLYDLYIETKIDGKILPKRIAEIVEIKKNTENDISFLQENLAKLSTFPGKMELSERFIEECLKKTQQNYCKLPFEEKKRIVNLIVEKAVFKDSELLISGKIPISDKKFGWLLGKSSEYCVRRQPRFPGRAWRGTAP